MSKTKDKSIIFAYGFDAAGFEIPSEPFESKNCLIHFIAHSAEQSLEKADGIIIPSGIFEILKTSDGYVGGSSWIVCANKNHLAKREKEVFQNFKLGGWTAFLLRGVENGANRWKDTDLAKRFLNPFFYDVECHDPNPHVQCKADEFANYLHEFGICRTTFWGPRGDHKPRALAADGRNALVAAELMGQFFFLPLPSIEKRKANLLSVVTKCAEAILEYKRRNDLHLPGWVESIEFQSEKHLRDEVKRLEEEIIQRREDLFGWRRYKGILSASGKALNAVVVELLRDYFMLELNSKEEFIEDAIIYTGGKPLFVVEIKGVNGGLKRDHVNQVDSHRERLGILPEVSGLLIINDFSDIDGLAERKAKVFDALHTSHAEKLNIKILRTTTLLEIIRAFEGQKDRGQKLVQLCLAAKPIVELPAIKGG